MIDLRSDTITRPTPEMRAAMAAAEVGDDVYQEDPMVNELERRAAELFAKEAALFVPTGTMGNQIAIKLHTNHGEEVACDSRSHIVDWELSMMAWFSGCIPRMIPTEDGILRWTTIERSLREFGPHNAPTTLISLENTHNMAGGTVYLLEVIDEIGHEAHKRGLKVHIDGARIFNAAAESGESVARIAQAADTVMFCLSKGLGAPVGSLLVGTKHDMDRGRLYRKRLGGGMRQAGILAAAGLIALEDGPQHLAQDHANARLLADGARAMGFEPKASTNIVIFDVSRSGWTTADLSKALRERGVLANGVSEFNMRLVTHRDVSREDCERALTALEESCCALSSNLRRS